MDQIIPLITTPLALAALGLLVFGGILTAVLRARGRARTSENRKIVVGTFALVIVLSVLANIAYLVQIFLFSEVLFAGNVRDTDNNPVKFAYVDVQAVGRAATGDDGSFQISIPYSRQRESYSVFSSAPGFASYSETIVGQKPAPKTILLHKLIARFDNSIVPQKKITLTQNIGDPLVGTLVKFENNIGRPFIVDDLNLTITRVGQEGTTTTLVPIYEKPIFSPQTLLPLHPIQVNPGMHLEMDIIWGQSQQGVFNLVNSLATEMRFHPSDFCTTMKQLPEPTTAALSKFFDSNFFWVNGEYEAEVSALIDGTRDKWDFKFVVNRSQSERLKNVGSRLKTCMGIGIPLQLPDLSTLYVNDDAASNAVSVDTN
jgi:hypothetical protein